MEIVIVNNKTPQFRQILQLQTEILDCGIKTSTYTINPTYGRGLVTSYYFDGLFINIINATFKEDFLFITNDSLSILESSVLIKGEKIIKASNFKKDFILERNECCLLCNSNIENKTFFYRDKPILEIKIKLYDFFIQKHQMQPLFSNNKSLELCFTQQLNSSMEKIIIDVLSNSQKGFLKRIFLESKVLELLHLQLNTFSEKRYTPNENILKKVHKAEAILQSNINKQIPIQQLARKVLLNQNILKSEFKKMFGTTIFNYTKQVRMNKAKSLLIHTQKPIYEVADMVGYKNPTHFTAAFKKYEKTTPKEFRKNSFLKS
ncbi:helix-turn-helix transcriptional regulator [Tenacibaculum sp.]|uniref:helix-turn-helix transcriptional regulator n=1 Tax=Tenacibaculum sp. TaxID=1906242 RepID=UPI003AA986D9